MPVICHLTIVYRIIFENAFILEWLPEKLHIQEVELAQCLQCVFYFNPSTFEEAFKYSMEYKHKEMCLATNPYQRNDEMQGSHLENAFLLTIFVYTVWQTQT